MKLPVNDYLIAEIGGNHEGNIEWALQMIGDAATAGANAGVINNIAPKFRD